MKAVLKTHTGTVSFSLRKTLWLYFILIPISFIDFSAITTKAILLTTILTFFTVGIGHSIGLHRGIIHKSYVASNIFRKASLYLFVLTGMGSPLNWLKQHYYRDYWQNREDCPRYFQYQHSLFTDYWWNLHMTFTPKDLDRYGIPKEDLNDPWIRMLHKTWYIHNLAFMLGIFLLTDLNTMLLATFLRVGVVILGHWYIGYASHKYGYSRFDIQGADESGYNDVLLGLISFGEGFHNNHHSHPTSAKFTMNWYEVDMGWLLIKVLMKLKIISNVKTMDGTLKTTAISHQGKKWRFPWNKNTQL